MRERERRSGTGQNRGEGLTLCRCRSQGERRQNGTRPENINKLAQQFIEGVKFDMHTKTCDVSLKVQRATKINEMVMDWSGYWVFLHPALVMFISYLSWSIAFIVHVKMTFVVKITVFSTKILK